MTQQPIDPPLIPPTPGSPPNTGPLPHQPPPTPAPPPAPPHQPPPSNGPTSPTRPQMPDVLGLLRGFFTRKPKEAREDQRSPLERMRDKMADFNEDYKDMGDRILGFFMSLIGYVGPFLLVAWIGTDLGRFFESSMGTFSAYGLSYTIEGIIAGCTVAMGRAFEEIANGKANWGKCFMLMLVWLILNASSAFGLYLVITHNGNVGGLEEISMVVRVVAIALADLGCSAILMMKGRSLQKHIDSVRKRATAIGELADAQRSMEEADKNAQLRDQMMKSTLKIQEDLSAKIGDAVSMVMESILEKMEKALKDDNAKNERGYGRR